MVRICGLWLCVAIIIVVGGAPTPTPTPAITPTPTRTPTPTPTPTPPPVPVKYQIPTPEVNALSAIKKSFVFSSLPASWQRGDFTLGNMSFCTLTGISCLTSKGTTNVVRLQLDSQAGSIPLQIGLLSRLTLLSLRDGSLTGTIPTTINQLTVLKAINLGLNQLSGTIPNMNKLVELQTASLYSNQLGGTLPDFFCYQNALSSLVLRENNLQGTVPACYFQVNRTHIQVMVLDDNRMNETRQSAANIFYYVLFPQDVDECLLKTARCPPFSYCSDGWSPKRSYTCNCSAGYYAYPLGANIPQSCNPRCGDGILVAPEKCDFTQTTPGCLNCQVQTGYNCNNRTCATICGDLLVFSPEECDTGNSTPGCQNCRLRPGFKCTKAPCTEVEDINECLEDGLWAQKCVSQQACINDIGDYHCCFPGYQRSPTNGSACIDINECLTGQWISNPLCQTQAQCINLDGSFRCCLQGFQRSQNGSYCEDIDECTVGTWTSRCPSQESCINTEGSFECCSPGYIRDFTNKSICVDVDECSTGQWASKCSRQDHCINTDGSFYCCPSGFTRDTLDPSKCVDINECLTGEWTSKCSKQVQCINTPGSFECCKDGFQVDWKDPKLCVDVNECQSGEWVSKCLSQETCFNTEGSFECCPPGSQNNGSNVCADIDECALKIDQCPFGHQTCINLPLTYNCCSSASEVVENGLCISCFTEWEPVEVTPAIRQEFMFRFPTLSHWIANNYSFDFLNCQGYCSTGIRVETRAQSSLSCFGDQTRTPPCLFACHNLTFLESSEATIGSLLIEWNRGHFLEDVMRHLFDISVISLSQSHKRAGSASISVQLDNCTQPASIMSILKGLAQDIAPNAPPLDVVLDPLSCRAAVTATDPPPSSVPLIVGLVVGLLFLVFIVLLILALMSRNKSLVAGLPDEVAWSFKLYEESSRSWEKRGTERTHYFYKVLKPGSSEFNKANEYFKWPSSGPSFTLQTIIGIYNPLLITNFVGAYQIQQERNIKHPQIFNSLDWDKTDNLRSWVYGQYKQFTLKFPWNSNNSVSIVPIFHGTDFPIAESICETGFAALSSLDAGFFGKGIYFTPDQIYTIPYIVTRRNPSLILSWVIPGNVYPVTESHTHPKHSLLGRAIKSGYNSHYVCTTKEGLVVSSSLQTEHYSELVVQQESQIVPAFIFVLEKTALQKFTKEWNRAVASEADSNGMVPLEAESRDEESFSLLSLDRSEIV